MISPRATMARADGTLGELRSETDDRRQLDAAARLRFGCSLGVVADAAWLPGQSSTKIDPSRPRRGGQRTHGQGQQLRFRLARDRLWLRGQRVLPAPC